jgi:hypothetical protein
MITPETVQYAFAQLLNADVPVFTVTESIKTGKVKIESEELLSWLTVPTQIKKTIRSLRIVSGEQYAVETGGISIVFYYTYVLAKKNNLSFSQHRFCTVFFTADGDYGYHELYEYTPTDGRQHIEPGKLWNNHQPIEKPTTSEIITATKLVTKKRTQKYTITL